MIDCWSLSAHAHMRVWTRPLRHSKGEDWKKRRPGQGDELRDSLWHDTSFSQPDVVSREHLFCLKHGVPLGDVFKGS